MGWHELLRSEIRRVVLFPFFHTCSAANFILPVFVHDGEDNIPIDSMPGVSRLGWQHGLIDAVAEARSVGVNQASKRCHRALWAAVLVLT